MPDSEEFARLVTGAQQRLYAYIYSLLGNSAASWDVLQETNMVMWNKRDQFELGTNFRAWAHSIGRFQVMAFLRDRKREPLCLLTPEILEMLQEESKPEFENYEARLNALATCLQRLKPTPARMIRLHYEEKRSLIQVGERLQMTVNAVKQSLFRARRNLQQCIEMTITQK
ncbi:sigma-70 family RNA polymerase sigma factor [bacterium]|nr:sigma-70 family RNA polymerase sigma factor [bacterium]